MPPVEWLKWCTGAHYTCASYSFWAANWLSFTLKTKTLISSVFCCSLLVKLPWCVYPWSNIDSNNTNRQFFHTFFSKSSYLYSSSCYRSVLDETYSIWSIKTTLACSLIMSNVTFWFSSWCILLKGLDINLR